MPLSSGMEPVESAEVERTLRLRSEEAVAEIPGSGWEERRWTEGGGLATLEAVLLGLSWDVGNRPLRFEPDDMLYGPAFLCGEEGVVVVSGKEVSKQEEKWTKGEKSVIYRCTRAVCAELCGQSAVSHVMFST